VRKEHAERGEPLPAVVGPGPDNPLGAYALRLAITPGAYLIHGTNNPLAVGMAVTHGCMRMYPEDVEALFPTVPVGTKVRIINEPVKTAFVNGELLLEAHPPVDAEGQTYEPNLELFSQLLDKALGPTTAAVHWDFARDTLQVANGLPTVVGLQADLDAPTSPDGTPVDANGAPVVDNSTPAGTPAPEHIAQAPAVPVAPASSPTQPIPSAGAAPATEQAAIAPAPASAPAQPSVDAIPAPLPPADAASKSTSGSARTYGADEPPAATAQPAQPPSP
jgi:lipoprotein-anchoring transpeptidase ErfK/SrfK